MNPTVNSLIHSYDIHMVIYLTDSRASLEYDSALFWLVLVFCSTDVPQFVPPSEGPLVASSNYVGSSSGSLYDQSKTQVMAGKVETHVSLVHDAATRI